MRKTFVSTLVKLARSDESVWLLTGDLGYGMLEPFIKEFPDRFLNVGVAEQNMVGIASGLALSGKKVFVYSISTFATARPYEQIRNDVCYQNLPVFIVGGGSGFSYSVFGCTHLPIDDLGLMNLLPNMSVVSPGDPIEVEELVKSIHKRGKPAYIRLSRNGEPKVHKKKSEIVFGKISKLKNGKDASLIVTGRLLPMAIEAAEMLAEKKVFIDVASVHTLKPIDEEAIVKLAKKTGIVVTCEEHLLRGGLGSEVLSVLGNKNINVDVTTLGITDEFPKGVGWQDYFLKRYKLTSPDIVEIILKKMNSKK